MEKGKNFAKISIFGNDTKIKVSPKIYITPHELLLYKFLENVLNFNKIFILKGF